MSAAERNPNDCIHCGGWTCGHCRPPHDPGEQGLTADEKQTIALKNRVCELEAEREEAYAFLIAGIHPGVKLYRAAYEQMIASIRSHSIAVHLKVAANTIKSQQEQLDLLKVAP